MTIEANMRVQSANPMHIVLVADNSGSLEGAAAASVTEAIKNWILQLQMVSLGKKPYFLFSFITFGSHSEVVAEAVNVNDVDSEVVAIRGDGGVTNMTAALMDAQRVLQAHAAAHHCPPFVFVFTDGVPTVDGRSSDTAAALQAAGVLKALPLASGAPRVVSLGFGEVNDAFMSQLATRPEFYKRVSNAKDLVRLLPEIGTPTQVGGRPATIKDIEKKIAEQNI